MKKGSHLIVILFVLAATAISCTDKFEDYNSDQTAPTELGVTESRIGSYFPQVTQLLLAQHPSVGMDWPYQVFQNLHADIYSGYMMTSNTFGNQNNPTYSMNSGWNSWLWNVTYRNMIPAQKKAYDYCGDQFLNFKGALGIMKVLAISRVSDVYGPCIYKYLGSEEKPGYYDSVKDLYGYFFTDLDNSIADLKKYLQAPTSNTKFPKFDQLFEGDVNKWIKFANSLKLRFAMRIVKVDPTLAKQKAEEAIAGGLMTDFVCQITSAAGTSSWSNPINVVSQGWGDTGMSAVMESILSGYKDPRLPVLFTKTTDDLYAAAGKEYMGIRQGVKIAKGQYSKYSRVNIAKNAPGLLMTNAEVYFLLAEASLRGWNTKTTAQEAYVNGVQASFAQYNLSNSVSSYLQSDLLPVAYTDYHNSENNVAAGSQYLNNVSPKWDDAATNEIKLQKIITQKWIAGFPEGINAWAEQRRTGYPKLFPVVVNESSGVIKSEDFIRRIPFLVSEPLENRNFQSALTALGGADNGATRIWWDVNKPNF